jgi:putative PIN family toxin of toxin-antitoxin system
VVTVTADTNVYVSGLVFGGVPLTFLEHARLGAFRLAVSPPLLTEIREVLRGKFAWSEDEVTAALSQLDEYSLHVDPTETLDAVPGDTDDNRILECAVAAQAEYVVTGDNHLLRLDRFRDIRILKVADFMMLVPRL